MATATLQPPIAPKTSPPDEEWEPWAPDDGREVSLEEYWRDWYDHEHSYEWNDGILEAKPMATEEQTKLFFWYVRLVGCYADKENAPAVTIEQVGFKMTVPDPKNPARMKTVVRKPDIGLIAPSNPVRWKPGERSYHGVFDLCIESLSDSDKRAVRRDTQVKWDEYKHGKVPEYFILDPGDKKGNKRGGFYRLNKAGVYVPITPKDGIIESVTMPGFRFRLTDLDRLPTLDELIQDPVYDFVGPETRAKFAELRARQEALEEENSAVKEENVAVKEENVAVNEQILEVKEENVAVKKENAAVMEEISEVKEENVAVKEENVAVKKENMAVNEEILEVKVENAALKAEIEALQAKLGKKAPKSP